MLITGQPLVELHPGTSDLRNAIEPTNSRRAPSVYYYSHTTVIVLGNYFRNGEWWNAICHFLTVKPRARYCWNLVGLLQPHSALGTTLPVPRSVVDEVNGCVLLFWLRQHPVHHGISTSGGRPLMPTRARTRDAARGRACSSLSQMASHSPAPAAELHAHRYWLMSSSSCTTIRCSASTPYAFIISCFTGAAARRLCSFAAFTALLGRGRDTRPCGQRYTCLPVARAHLPRRSSIGVEPGVVLRVCSYLFLARISQVGQRSKTRTPTEQRGDGAVVVDVA